MTYEQQTTNAAIAVLNSSQTRPAYNRASGCKTLVSQEKKDRSQKNSRAETFGCKTSSNNKKMRRNRNKPQPWHNKAPLKALAAVLLVGALFVAIRQQTQNEWASEESTSAEALRALRAADARARDAEAKAADADHALHEVRHTASTRNELNQALRARAQAADAAAAAAEAREQANDARAKAAERRAAQAEAALRASATRPLVKRTGPFRHVRVQAPGAPVTYPPVRISA